jgi:hypothetical protein
MYRAIDATAAQHPLVRGIHDGVDIERRDVATDDFNRHVTGPLA